MLLFLFALHSLLASSQHSGLPLPPASPVSEFSQQLGTATVKVSYSRPLARGRRVFGELVPFGALWRTGAGDCTTLESDKELIINNNLVLPPGKYSLFTIPKEAEWTIIINSDTTLHGDSGYDQAKDIFRFSVPAAQRPSFQEAFSLQLSDVNTKSEGFLELSWEYTQVSIPVNSRDDEVILAAINRMFHSEGIKDPDTIDSL